MVSLDDLDLRKLAREDPKMFMAQFPPPVVIDEFQYAPELLTYIKIAVDELTTRGRNREAAGMYWLTGSQNFILMKNVRESLAGRVAIVDLLGMDPAELSGTGSDPRPFFERPVSELEAWAQAPSPRAVFERIIGGSMPAVVVGGSDDETRRRYYSSYVQTYLERDVSFLDGVRNLREFELFFRLLAGRAAQLLNFTELSKEVGVSVNTIRAWTEILERSFHVFILPPFFRSFSKRLVKTPKIYFLDSGLHAYLTGWQDPETALRGPLAGQMVENWVLGLLVRSYWHRGLDPRLAFWRTSTGAEIDFLHDSGMEISFAEVELAASDMKKTAERQFRSLDSLDTAPFTKGGKYLIALGDTPLPLGPGLWHIPANYID
jgi:uncharacterized protein